LFVLSTAGVAICGSALANDVSNYQAWSLVLAFSALLFASDILRTTEDRAAQLAQRTTQKLSKARQDVFASGEPFVATATFTAGVVTIVAVLLANTIW
jgi:hypothetical protein